MSLRPTLRTAVLAAVGLGAVLLPSATAVADGTPTAVPAERTESPSPAAAPEGAESPSPAPEGAEPAEIATPVPAESVPAGTMPRGGVDAGERPAGEADGTALYGSAAGAVLLAGAGFVVMRRRSAAQRNG
ncbi:hypothetical protein [Streptomyces pratensis]|uniref:hypothetical protein n=1 Tax=Streptomyces pratensis TaxID=1169025 RepID=UPI0036450BFA